MQNPTSYAPSMAAPASPKSTYARTQLADVDSYVGRVLDVGTNRTGQQRNRSIDNICGKSYQVLGEQFNSVMDFPHVAEALDR